jgi:hypothetical protein
MQTVNWRVLAKQAGHTTKPQPVGQAAFRKNVEERKHHRAMTESAKHVIETFGCARIDRETATNIRKNLKVSANRMPVVWTPAAVKAAMEQPAESSSPRQQLEALHQTNEESKGFGLSLGSSFNKQLDLARKIAEFAERKKTQ